MQGLNRFGPAALPIVLAVALAARLYHLDAESFWFDEVATIHFSDRSFERIWGADTMPPLYYLLMSLWLRFGESEAWLRLSSVLISLAAVAVAYRIGREQEGRLLGFLLGLLLALAPFDVRYAQEFRMYALLNLAGAVALLGFFRLLRDAEAAARPVSLRRLVWGGGDTTLWGWRLYSLGAVLALYTHNTGVLLPLSASLAVLLLWWVRPERWALARNWLLVNGVVLVLWAFYWPWLLSQLTSVYVDFWISQPSLDKLFLEELRMLTGLPDMRNALEVGYGLFLLVLFLLGAWVLRPRALLPALLLLIVLPPAVELAVGLFRPLYAPRTLIWTQIPFLLVIATAAAWLCRPRGLRIAALAALVLVGGQAYALSGSYWLYGKPDWRSVARDLRRDLQPGDLVLVNPSLVEGSLIYQLGRQAARGEPLPEFTLLRIDDRENASATVPEDAERLWLLHAIWHGGEGPQAIEPRLREVLPCLVPVERRRERFVDIYLYEIAPQACSESGSS